MLVVGAALRSQAPQLVAVSVAGIEKAAQIRDSFPAGAGMPLWATEDATIASALPWAGAAQRSQWLGEFSINAGLPDERVWVGISWMVRGYDGFLSNRVAGQSPGGRKKGKAVPNHLRPSAHRVMFVSARWRKGSLASAGRTD